MNKGKSPTKSENEKSRMLNPEDSGHYVIVIGREFGSGGRTIGKLVASRLGISYYDRELLKQAAKSEGIDPEILESHEEKRPSVLKALLQGAYGIADNFHTVPLSAERVYGAQCKVIKEACAGGSCVIVGRNADFILRHHPRMLSVFLHSPISERVKRIISRGEAKNEEEAEALARKRDKKRESYYNFYTGENKWGKSSTYHLSIDTSGMNFDDIAALIIDTLRRRYYRNEVCRSPEGEESPGNEGDMLSNGKSAATSR